MDMNLKDRFEQVVYKHVDKDDCLVVAVSGGVDSVVLLNLLSNAGFKNLVVAHVDHGLREESGQDYEFVEALAKDYDLDFRGTKLTVDKNGSIEANARKVRYEFLKSVREECGAKYVVTAHHKNDQAETIMMNLCRGSFIKGMAGMNVVCSRKKVFRPLLSFIKQDLIDYTVENKLEFCVDASNQSVDFDRNFLRNEVFPQIETRFSAAQDRIADTSCFYREMVDFFDIEVKKWISENCEVLSYGTRVLKSEFEKLPNFYKFFLLTELVGSKFSQADFVEVLKLVTESSSGSFRQVENTYVYVTSDHFLVTELSQEALSGQYFGEQLNNVRLGEHRSIRTFKDGDTYDGKKLKEYFMKKNIPWYLRSGVPLCVDGEDNVIEVFD